MSELTRAKADAFKLTNAIEELTKMLSERLWHDDTIKDRFAMAGLADAARVAAKELHEIVECAQLRYKSESNEGEVIL